MTKRKASLAALLNESRYHVIRTPVNITMRHIKHEALLDSKKKRLIEGVRDSKSDNLLLSELSLHNLETIEPYIKRRESCLKNNIFSRNNKLEQEEDIDIRSVETQQNRKPSVIQAAWNKLRNGEVYGGGIGSIVAFTAASILASALIDPLNEQRKDFLPDEADIEQRWLEMTSMPKGKYKYDYSGEDGWNCEMVISFILTSLPEPRQGKEYEYLKKLGLLDRHGNVFGSIM
jgi:hypothetical protein